MLSEHSAFISLSVPCFFTDNVHFQNTAQLVAALTKAGVKYQVQVSGNVAYDNEYIEKSLMNIQESWNLENNRQSRVSCFTTQQVRT